MLTVSNSIDLLKCDNSNAAARVSAAAKLEYIETKHNGIKKRKKEKENNSESENEKWYKIKGRKEKVVRIRHKASGCFGIVRG